MPAAIEPTAEQDRADVLDAEPDTSNTAPAEPLPSGQRRVVVPFEQVLAARGRGAPSWMRQQIAPRTGIEQARRSAEQRMGYRTGEVLWPD